MFYTATVWTEDHVDIYTLEISAITVCITITHTHLYIYIYIHIYIYIYIYIERERYFESSCHSYSECTFPLRVGCIAYLLQKLRCRQHK